MMVHMTAGIQPPSIKNNSVKKKSSLFSGADETIVQYTNQ